VVLNGSWSFNVDDEEQIDECLIVGSEGSISFPFFGKTVTWQNGDSDEVHIEEFTHPQHIQQPMIERVVNFFSDKGDNLCSIEEAIIVMRMIDSFAAKP